MVDVVASENFELDNGTGLPSSEQSGAASPRLNDVPQSTLSDELLSVAENVLSAAQDSVYARLSEEKQGRDPSDADIYRGKQESPVAEPPAEDTASVAASSSSSSSSSVNVGRRLGALAGVVEAAISRWARAHSSASSTTSSSSSSSSVTSTTRTHTTRRPKGRRYSSSASVHNAAHERAFLALKRAQEMFRAVPREFTLLLPPDFDSEQTHPPTLVNERDQADRITRTESLSLILSQLDSALKKSAKAKRAADKGKGKSNGSRQANGKDRTLQEPSVSRENVPPRCWWLDIASPTWDDLRSIGKLLHLHPLTLEDILHRDPREKLELFPRLGYYFIVFRALEGEKSRERFRQFKLKNADGTVALPSGSADEGVIGAVNVYIVVFSEGICSFHFEDISEHTDKLRSRILQMQNSSAMTSDWIAHGIMDSIVDAFFPILSSIDKEINEVDSLVLEGPRKSMVSSTDTDSQNTLKSESSFDEKGSSDQVKSPLDEKQSNTIEKAPHWRLRIRFSESLFPPRHVKHWILKAIKRRKTNQDDESVESMTNTLKMLLRIAAIRRIVTSLGRLLGTKGEVVAQIRKRLILAADVNSASLGLNTALDGEVAIYMGDIQDHIATLQQSLIHYERMLSHSHPAYLSQLRVTQSLTKGGTDIAILLLTTVSITVVSMQVALGAFSMNVNMPNSQGSSHPFSVFFSVMAGTLLIGTTTISLVFYWRSRAKRKYSRKF